MKISFTNPTSKKAVAVVLHNGTEHVLAAGGTVNLNVKKGDTVQYKVGRLSATHTIDFQSPNAEFTIEADQKLQAIAFGIILVALVALYFTNLMNNVAVTTAIVVVWLIGYEVALYFGSYRTKVQH